MTKGEATQLAYNLVLETVKANAVLHGTASGSGTPKDMAKNRAEFLIDLHKALMAHFESIPVPDP